MQRVDTITVGWEEYELIDSGDQRKLERFGAMLLDRPDPQALWSKKNETKWLNAHARFSWVTRAEKWTKRKNISNTWSVSYNKTTAILSFGSFKHIGIFPEHVSQWKELTRLCQNKSSIRVLNLFGYTGVASIVAAQAKALVTHVDASKQTIATLKDNIKHSKLSPNCIRLVCEDALKYTKRLIQRGEEFDVIIMDPPAFGRGPKGEVWKIEEKLPELVQCIPKLLSAHAQMVLLNGYAAGYSARSFGELLIGVLKERGGSVVYGDVGIKEKGTERILTTGIYAKWTNEK